jgi:hypothetical protein
MNKKNTFGAFLAQNLHLVILGIFGTASLSALLVITKLGSSRIDAFGPTAKLYFDGIKNGLTISTGILLFSFAVALFFGKYAVKIKKRWQSFYFSLTEHKKNFLILALCFLFAFLSHSGSVMNGYFDMDDFMVFGVNRTVPLSQSIFIPHGNDHTMPLFRAEMYTLDFFFGQNPVPYNIFIFILFALIPFFTYLSFKKLGIGLTGFLVFLVIFSGATGWNEMMPGFYIMSIYPQTLFFFSVALWSYLAWKETPEKKYLFAFVFGMLGALAIDISGIWTLPCMALAILGISYMKTGAFALQKKQVANFFSENRIFLLTFLGVIFIFCAFFIYSFFVVQPNTFLSVLGGDGTASPNEKQTNWQLIPLARNFLSLTVNGVFLSLFTPKIARILAHPAVKESAQTFWPVVEIIALFGNVCLLWMAMKYAEIKEKKLILIFLGIMSVGTLMVIFARPNHEIIPDFDYRYAGVAFYAYCIFLSVGASLLLKRKKEYALKIIIPAIIIIFSAQQAFGFHSFRTTEESKMRREAITKINSELLSEFDTLSKTKKDGPLTIPNLGGSRLFVQTMGGFPLSYYVLFFNRQTSLQLIQSPEMGGADITGIVTPVSNLRASTSPEFIEALKKSEIFRKYFFSPSSIDAIAPPFFSSVTEKETLIREKAFSPEKLNTVDFTLYTDNTEGNLSLRFFFKNDFDANFALVKIKIDEYTPYEIENGKRKYHVNINLLGTYAFALSEKISHLTLSVPDTKNAYVENIVLR